MKKNHPFIIQSSIKSIYNGVYVQRFAAYIHVDYLWEPWWLKGFTYVDYQALKLGSLQFYDLPNGSQSFGYLYS